MLRKLSLVLLTVLNILPLIVFISFFRYGANIAFYMIPIWFIISVINAVFSKTSTELLKFNGLLALSSFFGIIANSQLYFKYICWDSEGELVMQFELFASFVYIAFLTVVEYLVKYAVEKRKNKLSE